MKRRNIKRLWAKIFGLSIGLKVRVNGLNAPTPVWCCHGDIGVIIAKTKNIKYTFYAVKFSREDNPKMVNEFDVKTFRERWLEVI